MEEIVKKREAETERERENMINRGREGGRRRKLTVVKKRESQTEGEE